MKTLSIDVESFSSVDLTKCGAARYVESPDFTILLFAYSCDFGPVEVVDFACGETLPPEIYEALYDPAVEKTAYNAPFERTTIGKYFDRYCPPEQWDCTMVLASCCGLPLGLKAVGEALQLSEDKAKMKEGSDLIKYFCLPCKPTKKNGGRTRNLPSDDPEAWEVFKAYNKRDVEVENTIRLKLLKWRPDWSEHKLWVVDQKINDRGMGVDIQLAENAIRIGEDYKSRLLDRAVEISGLENPNSTEQVKQWLREQEGVEVSSLNKKVVADVISGLAQDSAKEFMALRTEFSKSSTKKYEAMTRSVTSDGRIHGCFQFVGAGRTGRWCLAEGTPVRVRRNGEVGDLPIEEVTAADEVFDGERWVPCEGSEYIEDAEVIEYAGIVGTKDHEVYINAEVSLPLGVLKDLEVQPWTPILSIN